MYAQDNILYPLGYGLTYSKVVCTGLQYKEQTAEVTAENTGDRFTEEVIQLYMKDYGENAVPNHSLCGFKRIALKAGKERYFRIT